MNISQKLELMDEAEEMRNKLENKWASLVKNSDLTSESKKYVISKFLAGFYFDFHVTSKTSELEGKNVKPKTEYKENKSIDIRKPNKLNKIEKEMVENGDYDIIVELSNEFINYFMVVLKESEPKMKEIGIKECHIFYKKGKFKISTGKRKNDS